MQNNRFPNTSNTRIINALFLNTQFSIYYKITNNILPKTTLLPLLPYRSTILPLGFLLTENDPLVQKFNVWIRVFKDHLYNIQWPDFVIITTNLIKNPPSDNLLITKISLPFEYSVRNNSAQAGNLKEKLVQKLYF